MTLLLSEAEISEAVVIILAAGESRRMGRPKSALPFGGSTFLEHLIKTYQELQLPRVIVVVSDAAQLTNTFLPEEDCLVNPRPEEGPVSSIKIALETLPPYWPGYFIHPVDHPVVTKETILELYRTWGVNPYRAVKPVCDGHGGHPILLGRGWSRLIQRLPLTSNLRDLMHSRLDNVTDLPVSDPGVLLNVNNPAQYKQLLKLYPDV
jgi:molybdenum cofactor cytidylyltransferase